MKHRKKPPTGWGDLGLDKRGQEAAMACMRDAGAASGGPDLSVPWVAAMMPTDGRQAHFEEKLFRTSAPIEAAPPRAVDLTPDEWEAIKLIKENEARFWESHPDLVANLADELRRPKALIVAVLRRAAESFRDSSPWRRIEPLFSPYGVFSPLSPCDHGRRGLDDFEDWAYCPVCSRTSDDNGSPLPKQVDRRAITPGGDRRCERCAGPRPIGADVAYPLHREWATFCAVCLCTMSCACPHPCHSGGASHAR